MPTTGFIRAAFVGTRKLRHSELELLGPRKVLKVVPRRSWGGVRSALVYAWTSMAAAKRAGGRAGGA
eukprot:15473499-Alexandrium_andersonii.AAC.1